MADAGLLFGRKKSRTNPKMKNYIAANRNGFEMIDLAKTKEMLEKAEEFLKTSAATGKQILIVGTHPASKKVVEEIGKEFSYPYVSLRWLGGTLTNFDTIQKRLRYYIKLKADNAAGRLLKYTKKEQIKFVQELERLERLFGGLEKMDQMPIALLVFGANDHETAIREANIVKVPVVVVATTSADPDTIDHIVPANDSSISSVKWLAERFKKAIKSGLKK